MNDFTTAITEKIMKLNRTQSEFFSWLCTVRSLPFLGSLINRIADESDTSTLGKIKKRISLFATAANTFTLPSPQLSDEHLFSIFYAVDVAAHHYDYKYRTNSDCDMAYSSTKALNSAASYFKYDEHAIRVIEMISNVMQNTNLYAGSSVSNYSNIGIKFHEITKIMKLRSGDFDEIIMNDLDAILNNKLNIFNNNIDVYGEMWTLFIKGLQRYDCGYWSRLYQDLFNNKFRLDKHELDRRIGIPDEIKDKGIIEVGKYLERLGGDVKRLNEARIIILGEKGAGKTSIARRLVDAHAKMPEESESTEGVQTSIWTFSDGEGGEMNAHIWDFAGHSITHSAHRCFMSARCIYIYVYNGRIERDNNPVYWLEQIRIHGEDSRILFLINEKDEHRADIAEKTLKREYPSIVDYYRIDIGSEKKSKLENFRQFVMNMATNNPLWNNQIISSEAYKIKTALRKLFDESKPPHITYEDFEVIASEKGAPDEHMEGILDDLHALGICFWYKKEDLEQFNTLVLNPDWVTNAIYRIINKSFGYEQPVLSVNSGFNILKGDSRHKYPRDKVAFLFRLMKVYELAFFKSFDRIFIPGILPMDEPDDIPVFNDPSDRLTMSFIVEKTLPPNIASRIIVHRSEFGEIMDEKLLWRRGAVFKSSALDALALIVEESRSVTVRVTGEGKAVYLAELRNTIQDIFRSYKALYPNLFYEVLEPTDQKSTEASRQYLPERKEPLMVSENELIDCYRENRPYRDVIQKRFIDVDDTVEGYNIISERKIRFLFVTANENEKDAFGKFFKQQGINYVKGAPYLYGEFGNYIVAWFHMPSQGTSNPNATILCGEVIKEVSPIAVVMVGIAFGADEEKQKIGDVLVSNIILNYDSKKEREDATIYKETPKEVGFQLLNAFRSFEYGFSRWDHPPDVDSEKKHNVFVGAMLTGSVLVDNHDFRKKLLADFAEHEPIGGEMEAYGVYSQCRLVGVSEWIIVKSICDWGYNKQNPQKNTWQKIASESAVDFCHNVFSLSGGNGKGIFDDLC